MDESTLLKRPELMGQKVSAWRVTSYTLATRMAVSGSVARSEAVSASCSQPSTNSQESRPITSSRSIRSGANKSDH
eukprot:399996-Prymnesium_polylepis.1